MDHSQAAGLIYTELALWGRTAVRYVPKIAIAILVLVCSRSCRAGSAAWLFGA
jgi:hypothetical protein